MNPSEPVRLAVALALIGGAFFFCAHVLWGCGMSATEQARHTIEASARLVDVTDRVLAERFRSECAGTTGQPEAVGECVAEHDFDEAVRGIAIADRALRIAQAGLDTAEDIDQGEDWLASAYPCAAKTIMEGIHLAMVSEITIPEGARSTLTILDFLSRSCRPAPSGTAEGHSP